MFEMSEAVDLGLLEECEDCFDVSQVYRWKQRLFCEASDSVYYLNTALQGIRTIQPLFTLRELKEAGRFICYGAGYIFGLTMDLLRSKQMRLPNEIWDAGADEIGEKEGLKVKLPDFESLIDADDVIFVVCIDNQAIVNEVLSQAGSSVIACAWDELFKVILCYFMD